MRFARRVACMLAAGVAASASASAVLAAPPQPLFECHDEAWSVELLGTAEKRLVLVTSKQGPQSRLANVTLNWHEAREGHVVGQGGGHQRHIRLFDGVRHVILFEGVDGSLADSPGRTYAGVVTITHSNPAQDFRIDCAASEINARLVDNVTEWAGRAGAARPRPEDEGGPFDGWF